ncbi:SDR family oxidoreductase [Alteromonas halophila]|uniref:Short-chain dehydrogenase n=1 Tax=Alteromonas halophila TaxID=516698 RepID=A0A918JM10_9ALTE|nr:SDR family oxidoreductase [Alteromonas halophila]GGW84749.1 short-chain dehydrogenase [Alteromonas halophila]
MKEKITVLVGAGAIGVACARRVSASRHILLADVSADNAAAQAEALRDTGYQVTDTTVDVRSRDSVGELAAKAASMGNIERLICAAGVSPSNASADLVFRVDLLGTALVLDCFAAVMARGGNGLVISSQAGHRLAPLSAEQERQLALTPADALLSLPLLQGIDDAMYAYQLAKRGCALRVRAESVKWARRGARLNALSPGITMSPLARRELEGQGGDGYRTMIASSAARRLGTAEEVAAVAEFMMGESGAYICGSDFLIDGGVSAAYFYDDENS